MIVVIIIYSLIGIASEGEVMWEVASTILDSEKEILKENCDEASSVLFCY